MLDTPKGLRLHIGLFGARNAGKSSLANALTGQRISIVSDVAGTTTDPVEKACELAPIGPVVFIDTAGVDDTGELGRARVRRSEAVLEWVDLALVVCSDEHFTDTCRGLVERAKTLDTPVIVVLNKTDRFPEGRPAQEEARSLGVPVVEASASQKGGVEALRAEIVRILGERTEPDRPLVGELAREGDTVLLVTPIDTGAPKGRLILPQVQAIRELLDAHAKCIVVQEDRVAEMLDELRNPPKFIMTDSQVIESVARSTPESIPLTTFSIQMAYSKSDLTALAAGAAALARLKNGDRVLIGETCSHHPQKDDIGRVKIPRWLRAKTGLELKIDVAVGKDFPEDPSGYAVVIQCGGCVVTRRHMLSRLRSSRAAGVPMTNYGIAICWLQGVLERVLACHPEALAAYRNALQEDRS